MANVDFADPTSEPEVSRPQEKRATSSPSELRARLKKLQVRPRTESSPELEQNPESSTHSATPGHVPQNQVIPCESEYCAEPQESTAFISESEAESDDTSRKTTAITNPEPIKSRIKEDIATMRMSALTEAVKNAVIMIIDDERMNVQTVCRHLAKEGYHSFISETDSRKALAKFTEEKPDCLLLDISMPHESGMEILRAKSIDERLEHIPVIVLTASTEPSIKTQALDLGATDFLTKPVDPSELILRVRNALLVKSHIDHVKHEAARLEQLVQRRTAELYQSRQQLILSLARAAEHRDNETGNHVIRVGRYAGLIAEQLGWSTDKTRMLEQAAQLHDVGKIGIPDSLLFKPGELDRQEYELMKTHCALGVEIIQPLSQRDCDLLRTHAQIGGDILHSRTSPMLMMASRIAQTHHEHWNGKGYPLGLQGNDIPIEGRITAVADVYDALSSTRPYKKSFSREKCFQILSEGRGAQFDPDVLDAFFAKSEEIIEVQLKYMDRVAPIRMPRLDVSQQSES